MQDQDQARLDPSGLALIAALGEPRRALWAWNVILDEYEFDRLPNAVIRAMPQIYVNIRSLDDITELPRLRGVYRASWSSNLVTFGAIRPVVMAFNQADIDYRAIKGAAISALIGHWGQRTMGDIDLVVAQEDIPRALVILQDEGFHPLTADALGTGPDSTKTQGHFVSESGAVLDLHSPHGRANLFSQMFREPGEMKQLLDTTIRVPSSDVLLAVSVWHAQVASAGTDHIQTLLDMGHLSPGIHHRRTRNILLRSDLLAAGQRCVAELEAVGVMTQIDQADWSRRTMLERFVQLGERSRRFWLSMRRVTSIPVKLRNRRLTAVQRRALRRRPGIRSRLFEGWSRAGQFGRLERLIDDHLGGFGFFGPEGGPIPERDFRVTVPVERGVPGRLRIHFTFEDREIHSGSRILFIDGRGHGQVPLPGLAAGIYEITPERDVVQISARPCDIRGSSRISQVSVDWEVS